MSGSATQLIYDSTHVNDAPFFSNDIMNDVRSAMTVSLGHQYAAHSRLPGRLFRVVCGSGQGILHSGDIADLSLAHMAELLWAMTRAVWRQFGFTIYTRFKAAMCWPCTPALTDCRL